MTVTERVAYIRGLFEGLEINVDKKEGRLFKEMISVLEDMALSIADLEEENEALQGVLDAMIEDIYDDDDSYDEEDVSTEDGMEYDPDNALFEVVCPSCSEEIFIDEATLEQGNISCPACGEELEFDMSSLEDEDVPAFSDIPEGDYDDEIPEDDAPEIAFDQVDGLEDEEDEDEDD
ncbi:MAG: hypothetical protein Q4D42_11225 [Eubacteriales bacterium]|nr:hypothetical protein [Eubacteriales bacterium]